MEPEKENEVVQTEEPVKTPTLNKNGKPRKELTEEAKIKLAKAREKANAIRAQNSAKKLQSKADEKNDKAKEVLEPKQNVVPLNTLDEIEEEVEIVKEKPKSKGKKKTKIIVEQSSEDSDEFEPNDNVVFVKRVSRKKKEQPPPAPVQHQEPQMERPPIEPPEPPPKPKLTPQQIQHQRNYEMMCSGSFLNNNPMRRHY